MVAAPHDWLYERNGVGYTLGLQERVLEERRPKKRKAEMEVLLPVDECACGECRFEISVLSSDQSTITIHRGTVSYPTPTSSRKNMVRRVAHHYPIFILFPAMFKNILNPLSLL